MDIQGAILCDFAQVREGMLFVSSGGVSRVYSPDGQPVSLGYLALVLEIDAKSVNAVHEVRVTLSRNGGEREVGRVTAALQIPPEVDARLQPGEAAVVPIVFPLGPARITEHGMYDVRVSLDGGTPVIRTVYVLAPPD